MADPITVETAFEEVSSEVLNEIIDEQIEDDNLFLSCYEETD